MMALFGAILPRFMLLVVWSNDQTYWANLLGMPVWFLGGFLFFPWTTLVYGFAAVNGLSLLNWIFIGAALLIDRAGLELPRDVAVPPARPEMPA